MELIKGARYFDKFSNEEFYYVGGPGGHDFYSPRTGTCWHRASESVDAPASPARIPVEVAVKGPKTYIGPTMGTDPEFFLENFQGVRLPAFDILESKHTTKNGLFWDGFQAETRVSASLSHSMIVSGFASQLRKLPMGVRVAPATVWRIPEVLLRNASDACVALGCDPSHNVYDMQGTPVEDPRQLKWRFAGGHLHFQLMQPQDRATSSLKRMVKALDLVLGVPSVAMAAGLDNPVRRKYYGLAGEFRLPPHGLEWRTLSNWYWLHPQAAQLVLDLAEHAVNIGRSGLGRAFIGTPRDVVQIINTCDVRSARDLTYLNRDFYNLWAVDTYGGSSAFWRAVNGGIKAAIPSFGQDVLGAWKEVQDLWNVPTWRHLEKSSLAQDASVVA